MNAGLLRLGVRGVADDAVRSDPGDFAAVGKREPEVAVLAHRDRERLAASTDRDASGRRCLGGSNASGEGKRRHAADEFETKASPRDCQTRSAGLDEMKFNFHA